MLDQDGRPLRLTWNYTRAEIIADGVIHAIGVSFGIAGAVVLVLLTIHAAGGVQTASALIYAIGLVALLGFSAAYNMWPVSRWKWLLRRCDHSAIYLLIAATYTPFLVQMKTDAISIGLLAGIWTTALAGIALKLFLPGRFDRFSVCLYLILGWSGVLAYDSLIEPLSALHARAAGCRRCALLDRRHIPHATRPALPERSVAFVRARRGPLPLSRGT